MLKSIHRLVLFQVTASQIWRGFELIPFVFLGIFGGIFGHYFIRLNIAYARFRASDLSRIPILEVTIVSLITALVSYLVIYSK
jgi:chloride channel 3/4/5